MEANVKVSVRVRKLLPKERGFATCVRASPQDSEVQLESQHDIRRRIFTFDSVFDEDSTQNSVFHDLGGGALGHALAGFNTCVFAYGQTNSGKTYTMMGGQPDTPDTAGVIPRSCEELFRILKSDEDVRGISTSVQVSFYEIYNEKPFCLLNGSNTTTRVREHPILGPFVEGVAQVNVECSVSVLETLRHGARQRHTASTKQNVVSSRSHAVCTLTLTRTRIDANTSERIVTSSRMNLVDLAGSEKASAAETTGQRLVEGNNIGKSLLNLGMVISALVEKRSHVPYRDSILTWLLKDALGGNSRTHMVATVSPCIANYDETYCTLQYADRAKKIKNIAHVNVQSKALEIFELQNQLRQMRELAQRMETQLSIAQSKVVCPWEGCAYLLRISPAPCGGDVLVHTISEGTTILGAGVGEAPLGCIYLDVCRGALIDHCSIEWVAGAGTLVVPRERAVRVDGDRVCGPT